MIVEHAERHIKDVIISFLRLYFRNPKNYMHKLPRQISKDYFAKAVFFDTEPEELREFPLAIITTFSGTMVTAGLSDFCQEIKDPRSGSIIAYRYQGFYEFGVQIDIGCKNTLERETFADLIAKALRFSLRRFIQNQGIIIKNVSYSNESTIDYNSDKIYIASIKLDTWSSWIEDVELLDPNEFSLKGSMSATGDDATDAKSYINTNTDDYRYNGEDKSDS